MPAITHYNKNNRPICSDTLGTAIVKSMQTTNGGRIVEGVIATADKDLVGDLLPPDFFDTSNVERGLVRLKYEHSGDAPGTSIGVVHKTWKDGKNLRFRGEVFNSGTGKLIIEEADQLAAINNRNKTRHRFGTSVEAATLKNRTPRKALLTAIAITNKPVNPHAYIEFQKSLEAGYANSPSTQTGGSALRNESLLGTPKNVTIPTNKKKGRHMTFANEKEAYDYAISEGKTPEEARKFATEAMQNAEDDIKKSFQDSLTAGNERFDEAIQSALNALATDSNQHEGDIAKSLEININKSLSTPDDQNIAHMLVDNAKVTSMIYKSLEAVQTQQSALAEAVVALATGLKEQAEAADGNIGRIYHKSMKIDTLSNAMSGLAKVLIPIVQNAQRHAPVTQHPAYRQDVHKSFSAVESEDDAFGRVVSTGGTDRITNASIADINKSIDKAVEDGKLDMTRAIGLEASSANEVIAALNPEEREIISGYMN